jgi:transcriptional regulator with XRE-family HTH domain
MQGASYTWHGPSFRAWREQRGFTAKALASRLSIGAPHITNIEQDRRKPSLDVALEMARALGIRDLRVVMSEYPDEPLPVDRLEDWPEEWRPSNGEDA